MSDFIDARSLTSAGMESWERFGQTGDRTDLDHAIAAFRAAVSSLTHDGAQRAANLYHLLCTLEIRHDRFGETGDLDDAIRAGSEAVDLDPSHAGYLSALGTLLYARFLISKQPSDIDQAITVCRKATTLPPTESSDVEASLSSLATALDARYRLYGSVDDLEQSADLQRTALALSRPGPSRKKILINLASGMCELFELRGRPEALEDAVTFGRRAVNARPRDGRDQAWCLDMFANVLEVRYSHYGSPEDLDEAIESSREALDLTPADHVNHGRYLEHLLTRLSARSRLTRSAVDIDEALKLARAYNPDKSNAPEARGFGAFLLMVALHRRYEWDGSISYLDEAIMTGRAGVALFGERTRGRAIHIRMLSNLLWVRFRQFGSIADLETTIRHYRAFLAEPSVESAQTATDLSQLGMLLWARYVRTENRNDLDEAVNLSHEAVANTRHAEDRAVILANLGLVLGERFKRDGQLPDLDESIVATRSALAAKVRSSTDRARFHANLAYALVDRFKLTGESDDLDQAVADGLQCAELISDSSPERARFLRNLGQALEQRFVLWGHEEDRDAAIAAYEAAWASDAAPAFERIVAAWPAAKLIESSDPHRAIDLMAAAARLLPEVSPRRLARGDQQDELRGAGALVAEAASLALEDDRLPEPERALQALTLLEIGRGVLIGQALENRSDLSELRVRHPDLAARFVELRDFLDSPSELGSPLLGVRAGPGDVPVGTPDAGGDRHVVANEFNALLDRIRALDGFEAFGRPPLPAELLAAGQEGPVVVLTVSSRGGHALLITRTGVTAKALPRMVPDELGERFNAFQAMRRSMVLSTDLAERRQAASDVTKALEWLWDAVAGPVLDALGLQQQPPTDQSSWPRVWWVPCGVLSVLPIHAAGHHSALPAEQPPRTVIDRVVSSYTPSVRMLVHTRRRITNSLPSPSLRAMVVAMPTTPGMPNQGRLPNVPEEVKSFRRLFPQATILEGDASGAYGASAPVRDQVLARLPVHEIVHFSCHAEDYTRDPSRSRLLLTDHESNPLTVASLIPLELGHAQLAFLSACNTGSAISRGLADESIHLASAFQIAGFDNVVSTLWEIDDKISVTIADSFYTNMQVDSGDIDVRLAAQALHHAVRDARDRKDRPGSANGGQRIPFFWAAYIHVGA